ncbi:MAG: hypothetical protein ACFB00_08045 [Parvularculaceae bacterium]
MSRHVSDGTMTRRDAVFLLSALAATAAAPSGGRAAAAGASAGADVSMTRVSLIHNALSLLVADADMVGEWRDAFLPLPVGAAFEFSYAYGVAALGDPSVLVMDIVREARDGWATRAPAFLDIQRHKKGMLERRLTVAVAAAADRRIARALDAPGPIDADALDGIFLRALTGVERIDRAHATRVFRVLYERAFIAMHTIEPDLDGLRVLDVSSQHEVDPVAADVNRYLDAYADWIDGLDERCARLARAVSLRPPRGFPAGDAFWRADDPEIARAMDLQRGVGLPVDPMRAGTPAGSSLYARALAAGRDAARLVLNAARGREPEDAVARLFDA